MTHQKSVKLTRREALQGGMAFLSAAAVAPAVLASDAKSTFGKAPAWLALLGVSEQGGRSYVPRVEGRLPDGLSGTLFRNGPGLFERGGHRKANLLDGDGLVQRLRFGDGQVHYRNAFVRTPKFIEEEAAGELKYATWTTRAPGGMLSNLGANKIESQAGVTIYAFGDKVYAFDEMNPGFEVDPDTLETLGSKQMGRDDTHVGIKAHTKFDPQTGDWIFAGGRYGRTMELHTLIYDKAGRVKEQHVFESPRQCYFHDFFVSENYVIFLLHPLEISLMGFLGGTRSFTDSLVWNRDLANLIAVCPKAGGEPRIFEAPASFMWHSLNAFEEKGKLIMDFTGYQEPDHFVGEDAFLYNIMEGRMGRSEFPGKIRRYEADLATGRLTETILNHESHDFAMMDPRLVGLRHRVAYFSSGDFADMGRSLSRLDYETGDFRTFDFGDMVQVGEPIFAPAPGGQIDDGWLLVQCLDGKSRNTFFAILDARHLEDGPLAKIWLDHHMPISFHGAWKAA